MREEMCKEKLFSFSNVYILFVCLCFQWTYLKSDIWDYMDYTVNDS